MSKSVETQLCLDSFNRDRACYPASNDFVLDLRGRYEVQMAVLASIEVPQVQRTIEDAWSSFSVSVGISPPEDEAQRTLAVRGEDGLKRTATLLPTAALRATRVDLIEDDPNLLRFATAVNHGITTATLAMLPVLLVLGTETGPVDVPVERVVGEREFLVRWPQQSTEEVGVLLCCGGGPRAFAGPSQLASVLSANLRAHGFPLQARFTDSGDSGRIPSLALSGSCALLQEPGATLPSYLGLSIGTSGALPPLEGSPRYLLGVDRRLPSGNCDQGGLRRLLAEVLDPCHDLRSTPAGAFGITLQASQQTIAVTHTATMYRTPHAAASGITLELQTSNPQLARFSLAFRQDAFVFMGPSRFVLRWGRVAEALTQEDVDLARALGFDPYLAPRVSSREGDVFVLVGNPIFFVDFPVLVTVPPIWRGASVHSTRRLVFEVSPHLGSFPVKEVSSGDAPGGLLSADAPGECLAWLGGASLGMTQSGGRIRILTSDPPPVADGGTRSAVLYPYDRAALNLSFLHSQSCGWSRLAEVMGFPLGTSEGVDFIEAPSAWNLDPPAYLLVDFGLEHMSARVRHRLGEDQKSSFMGKVPLFAPYRWERGLPLMKVATGINVVSQLRVRLWNPWHQLYELHGREWSATLIFSTHGLPAMTECA